MGSLAKAATLVLAIIPGISSAVDSNALEEERRNNRRHAECSKWYGDSSRTSPANLDEATIRSLPDKGLSEALLSYAYNMRDQGLALPYGLQLLVAISELDGEVNNGGFIQYFWNSTGSGMAPLEALTGFRAIGAESRANVLERALEIRTAEREKARPLVDDRSVESISKMYEVSGLDAVTKQYFADESCIWELVTRKARQQPAFFAAR